MGESIESYTSLPFEDELKYVEDYLNRPPEPGAQAIVYSFSPKKLDFSIRFAVSLPQPYVLMREYGVRDLYTAWQELNKEKLPDMKSIEDRAKSFEKWLFKTPVDEIKAVMPTKPLEKIAISK